MEVILTEKQLEEDYLPFWQSVLSLQDWRITVSIVRERDMLKDHRGLANCWRNCDDKAARIQIRDQADFNPEDFIIGRDMEDDLVHELVHIVFTHLESPRDRKVERNDDLERAITQMTAALITLKRRNYQELLDRSARFAAAVESRCGEPLVR